MLEQVLASRYRLLQPLALGGFSQTYVAEDIHIPGHPHCVVKKLQPATNDSSFLEIARRLFNSEAEVLQKVGKHPQIPALLAYFEEDREFYLVQDFISGINLKDDLPLGTCWSELQVLSLLQDCLGILEFVHGQGVIHRDIKPANLMRRQEDGRMVLLDFGAVKQIGVDQHSQIMTPTVAVGTQGYMPDEQLRGRPNFTSDLYALGMIGVQALTGLDPTNLERGEDDEIVWQPQGSVSEDTRTLISKMIRRDHRKRYQSAPEILGALREIQSTPTSESSMVGSVSPFSATQVVPDTGEHSTATSATQTSPQAEPHIGATIVQGGRVDQFERSNANAKTQASAPLRQAPPTGPTQQVIPLATAEEIPTDIAVPQDADAGYSTRRGPLGWLKSTNPAVIGLIVLLSGAAASGLYFTRRATLAKTIDQLQTLYDEAKYTECVSQAETAIADVEIPADPVKGPLARCQLGIAQVKADQSSYAQAIDIATKIPAGNPYHGDAQKKIDTWSTQILAFATKTYEEKGKLKDAVAAANLIPNTSAVAKDAAKRTKAWQTNNKENGNLIKAAKTDLDNGRSEEAIAKAKKITAPKYWKQKADQIKQDAQQQIARRPPPAPVRQWQPAPSSQTRSYSSYRSPSYSAPSYSAPAPRQPAYNPPPRQAPAPRQPAYNPPPRQAPAPEPAPRKQVVRVCPGPLCAQ